VDNLPYSTPFVKVNIEGHFGGSATTPVEKWSAGFHVANAAGIATSQGALLTYFTALATPATTFFQTTNTGTGTNTWLTSISGALIGVDGKYALGKLQSTTRYTLPTPAVGVGGIVSPWPTACVLSLRSVILRGPGSHGRMYWPTPALSPTAATGIYNAANVNAIATAAQTFFNAVNTASSTAFGSGSYVSNVSPIGLGAQATIVNVNVGFKPDHMESRESSLLEAYVIKPLTVSTTLLADRDDEFLDALKNQ
jgi:hypothetical protein